ncbi:uncharacterized protein LOC129346231 [Eublepharis macularius]|uniref:Uncharacterized protein LOC129346231 n=1 Tax=Eublepharis macularius TaxID=481883 RepID=A0AA97KN16_EUBMA|nr:uncharacterized protein LOC129346231 [Eublepharis macularius]
MPPVDSVLTTCSHTMGRSTNLKLKPWFDALQVVEWMHDLGFEGRAWHVDFGKEDADDVFARSHGQRQQRPLLPPDQLHQGGQLARLRCQPGGQPGCAGGVCALPEGCPAARAWQHIHHRTARRGPLGALGLPNAPPVAPLELALLRDQLDFQSMSFRESKLPCLTKEALTLRVYTRHLTREEDMSGDVMLAGKGSLKRQSWQQGKAGAV